jgi:cytoskeletal protein CcmA (bactofilin family)
MAWGGKQKETPSVATDQVENVLGRTAHVRGDLKAEGAFRVDGIVEGSVESKSSVVIGGQVTGNIVATGHLDIVASGRIEGDVDAQSVRIETGGVFRGTSRMGGERDKAEESPSLLASVK